MFDNLPTSKIDATTDQELTLTAFDIARTTYGSEFLTEAHERALFYIAGRLTHMVTGHARQQFHSDTARLAYGLQCGGGKTLSAKAWIGAVNRLGRPYSVAVAQNEINALIEFRRELIKDFGVPEEKIGLLHRMGNAVEVPTTPDDELSEKQFLLVSHNMVRTGQKNLELYNTYQGDPRDLVIFDESLIVSESWSLKNKMIRAGLDFLDREVEFSGQEQTLGTIRQYVRDTLALFLAEVDAQRDDGKRPEPVAIPDLTTYAEDLHPDGAKQLLRRFKGCPRAVHALLDVSGREVRPVSEAERGVVWFQVKVPEELKSVFVLDASHLIRELPTLDANLIEDKAAVDPDITFPDLTIEFFQTRAGRGAITDECQQPLKDRKLAKKIAKWINSRPEDEKVNVWTFKKRDVTMDDIKTRKPVDIPGELERALRYFKVDMDRVTILTHGQAKGSNSYADAPHTAFYGVYELDKLTMASQMVGQAQDLSTDLDHLERVHKSEILHDAFQEIARSGIRKINQGRGGRGTVLFPCWHLDVSESLNAHNAFRGATLVRREDLEDQPKVPAEPAKYTLVAESIVATLREMPEGTQLVGTSKLRPIVAKRVGFKVSPDVWKTAFSKLQGVPPYRELPLGVTPYKSELAQAGWMTTKRGFRRLNAEDYGF